MMMMMMVKYIVMAIEGSVMMSVSVSGSDGCLDRAEVYHFFDCLFHSNRIRIRLKSAKEKASFT